MFSNLSNRTKLITLVTIVIALIAIPLTIIQVQKQQKILQHAASGDSVSFNISQQSAKVNVGQTFNTNVYLLNSFGKDISSVDVVIQYDSSILGINFQPNGELGYTTVLNETKGNAIHYIAVNSSRNLITGVNLPLGTLILEGKADGKGKISLENIQITAAGNSEKLAIDTSTGGTLERQYTIGDINFPSATPSTLSSTPTPSLTPDTSQLYSQCLKLCEQGVLVSEAFDKPACIQECDNKYKQPESVTATPIPELVKVESKCEDTDANEKDPFVVKGEAIEIGEDGVRRDYRDFCNGQDRLVEYTCNDLNRAWMVQKDCNCVDGACTPLVADLIITDVKFRKEYDAIFADVTVKNISTANVNAESSSVAIQIENLIEKTKDSIATPLSLGVNKNITVSIHLDARTKEGQEVIATVDAANAVDETDETNNQVTVEVEKLTEFSAPRVSLDINRQTVFVGGRVKISAKAIDGQWINDIRIVYGASNELDINKNFFYKSCKAGEDCVANFEIEAKEDGNLFIVASAYRDGYSGIEMRKDRPSMINGKPIQLLEIIKDGTGFARKAKVKVAESLTELSHSKIFIVEGLALEWTGILSDDKISLIVSEPKTVNIIDLTASVEPQKGTKDTMFSVSVKTELGLQVSIELPLINGKKEISLYDDGDHGDEKPADGIYVNVLSGLDVGLYNPKIIIRKDTEIFESKLLVLSVSEGKCSEILSGQNDPYGNRVNIVFVGYGYGSDEFRKKVKESVDPDEYGSILSIEPYKSNKDKFNFWYVTETSLDIPEDMRISLYAEPPYKWLAKKLALDKIVRRGASDCKLDNPIIVNFVKEDISESRKSGYVFQQGVLYVYDLLNRAGLSGYSVDRASRLVFVHEFAHAFAFLQDEYIGESNAPIVLHPVVKFTIELASGLDMQNNVIKMKSKEECLEKAPWKDMIGNGCGKDGVVDCSDSEQRGKPDKTPDYKLETGCFNDPREPSLYRSTITSLMQGGTFMGRDNVDLQEHPTLKSRIMGLYNEKLLCRRIKDVTGSAGGICNNFKLD